MGKYVKESTSSMEKCMKCGDKIHPVDAKTGTARVAVAQPIGSKAVEVGAFKDPTAGKRGPFSFQMHNGGLFDEYKDITIEVNPVINDLITTK